MSVSERNVQSISHGKINMNTNTFEAPNELVFVPVWIANSVTKNVDRKDIRELHAKIMDEGDSRIAFLCETFCELDRMNFNLTEGCELRDGSGRYKCIRVDLFHARKKKAWLTLKRIAA